MIDGDIEFNSAEVADAFFFVLLACDASFVGFQDAHSFIVHGIGTRQFRIVDETDCVLHDFLTRVDPESDGFQILERFGGDRGPFFCLVFFSPSLLCIRGERRRRGVDDMRRGGHRWCNFYVRRW